VIDPIFVSHGSPTLLFDDLPAGDFLLALGQSLLRPKAVLVVSAHWETNIPAVNAVAFNETIHNFGGLPEILFDQRYPAPGDTALAERGMDHGGCVPLKLIFPEADMPVLHLSVQTHLGAAHH